MDRSDFLMRIEKVDHTRRGIFAEGTVSHGIVYLGDSLEIVGDNHILKTFIAAIEKLVSKDKKTLEYSAQNGDTVRLLLTNSHNDNINVGQIISTPQVIGIHSKFKARISLLNDKKNKNFISDVFNAQITLRTSPETTGIFYFSEDSENVLTNDSFIMLIVTDKPIAVGKDLIFSIYKCEKKIGTGVVVEIIE